MATIKIEYTEADLKSLILEDLYRKMPDCEFEGADIQIQTRSKQNYKSEWETAAFRAEVNKVNA